MPHCCSKCGKLLGTRTPKIATWHIGKCNYCEEPDVAVTEARDYGIAPPIVSGPYEPRKKTGERLRKHSTGTLMPVECCNLCSVDNVLVKSAETACGCHAARSQPLSDGAGSDTLDSRSGTPTLADVVDSETLRWMESSAKYQELSETQAVALGELTWLSGTPPSMECLLALHGASACCDTAYFNAYDGKWHAATGILDDVRAWMPIPEVPVWYNQTHKENSLKIV